MPRSRTAGAAVGASWPGLAGACVAKRVLQDSEAPLELLVRRRERRQEPDDVAVEAAREEEQALLARRRRHRAGGVGRPLGELEREHRAEPADLADDRVPRGHLVEPRTEQRPDLVGALAEAGRREL